MAAGDRPAVIAYDGSEFAEAAVRTAAELFGSRPLLIATAWDTAGTELALGSMDSSMPGVAYMPVDPVMVTELEHAGAERANHVAEAGVRLATELGATAEAVLLESMADPATAIGDLAASRDAAVVVVGSRGHSGLRERVLGSTSKKLVHHCACPVLVVHKQD